MNRKHVLILLLLVNVFLLWENGVVAQGPTPRAPRAALGTGFTYQGQIKNNGAAYSGACDIQFKLYDAQTVGTQIGTTQTATNVSVANGLFTTQVDFGTNALNGDARWLEIGVRCPAGSGNYTTFDSRQALTATPYAITALKTAYKNVLVVAQSGGHYNTITAALNSIGDNSATNRYLISIAPGTYNEKVIMKEYVDIEGAGEIATKITYSSGDIGGTVKGVNNAELRYLSVENTGGLTDAVAIYNNSVSPRLSHLTLSASGGTNNFGVRNVNSSPTIANVTITASGGTNNYGVSNTGASTPTLMDMIVTASGGTNYGVYNNVSAPTMTDVIATASGGTTNYGVYNTNTSLRLMRMTVTASGGTTNNYGIYNTSSTVTTINVTASASGGTTSAGVYNQYTGATIHNSTIGASGATNNYGIHNYLSVSGNYTVTVNNSQIKASTNTIRNDYGVNTRVGASKLDGGAVNVIGGTVGCAGVYDENYTLYGYNYFPTCP